MPPYAQLSLFESAPAFQIADESSTTFVNNMDLPVHRWFRYSAGFAAEWVEAVLRHEQELRTVRLLDPFAGSGTSLIVARTCGVESVGLDPHPFVSRVARAKLCAWSDPEAYRQKIRELKTAASAIQPDIETYPTLIRKCYDDQTLARLDQFRRAYEEVADDTPASNLAWLTLVGILRKTSKANTAQWQYVLPNKQKKAPAEPSKALDDCMRMFLADMRTVQSLSGPSPVFLESDARTCQGVPEGFANLVITSPPYPNNYDYADAARLEMSFLREIRGWGCLQQTVRKHLIRSCSQHVPESSSRLEDILQLPQLAPICDELTVICNKLSQVRLTKGGRKTYHLMVASYFADLALTWHSLRRACACPSKICFVIGDSAPYGVYVPVVPWMGALATAAGFRSFRFEKTRDRNMKWKNRKHRVPLQEGRLWVEG